MSINREMNKEKWYIYTTEYYSAIKSNKVVSLADTWIDLSYRMETIIQNEVEKNKYNILLYICGI